jgi:hypothetical protein
MPGDIKNQKRLADGNFPVNGCWQQIVGNGPSVELPWARVWGKVAQT